MLVCWGLTAPPRRAGAHTIPGGITLSERVLLSDVVVVATIEAPTLPDSAPEKRRGRLLAEAKVTERIYGESPKSVLRFEPHSHSGESYAKGESVILFLRADGGPLETVEDVSDHVSLGTERAPHKSREEAIAAVRAYAKARSAKDDAARASERKEATLSLLRVSDSRLRSSALRDIAQGAILITEGDVPLFLEVADDPKTPMAIRVALFEQLARKGLFDPIPRYATLLNTTSLVEMEALSPVAGKKASPQITSALVARLGDSQKDIAAAAARALGAPFHEEAVSALARSALADDPKLSTSAIQSLGRIGTPRAREALADLLTKTEDPRRRRQIETELNRMARSPAPQSTTSSGSEASASEAPVPPESPRKTLWLVSAVVVALLGALGAGLFRGRSRSRGGDPPR